MKSVSIRKLWAITIYNHIIQWKITYTQIMKYSINNPNYLDACMQDWAKHRQYGQLSGALKYKLVLFD